MNVKNLQVKLMKTLWENTYRAMVQDIEGTYVATVRLVVTVPLSPELRPADAPDVEPQLFVLVEDGAMQSADIIDFETTMAAILEEKFHYQIPRCFFFYPSPEDMLSK